MTDPPIEVLHAAGVPYELFRQPGAVTFEDVLREMGFPPDQMIKTVAFRTGPDALLLASLPSPRRLSYGALARAAGVSRGRMRPADGDDLRVLGMEPGGVSPVTHVGGVTAVFDESMARAPHAYLGSRHLRRADQRVPPGLRCGHRGGFGQRGAWHPICRVSHRPGSWRR